MQTYPLRAFSPFSISESGWKFTGISGMSYHGGFIGFLIGFYFFTRSKRLPFFQTIDLFVVGIALGYLFGRLGNFMNGELYGRVTDVPWGMYFTNPATLMPHEALRHPSQLYEAFVESLLVFTLLWLLRNKPFPSGWLSSFYVISYSSGRFYCGIFPRARCHFQGPRRKHWHRLGLSHNGTAALSFYVAGRCGAPVLALPSRPAYKPQQTRLNALTAAITP